MAGGEANTFTIGTLLEEMNGVNQMYGRKMIFITNNYEKLINIHNGALIRPGRVDLKVEFKNLLTVDVLNLIKIYYPNEFINNDIIKNIVDYKYTAAELSNMCKYSKTINDLLNKIK